MATLCKAGTSMQTAARNGLCKDPGFLACTIFLCLGLITCAISCIPLVLCAVYHDHMVVGLSEDLKIAGVGFLVFGLLVVTVSIVGMVVTADSRRRKRDEMVDYILEENDELGYSAPTGFINQTYSGNDRSINKMKDVPL